LKILLFLLAFSLLFSDKYPNFTKQELDSIKNELGQIAKNRAVDYDNTVKSFQKLPRQKQLIKVNIYLNQLLPQVDMLNQKKTDHWETPKEFLTCGYGDCEDYAIIKYFTLLKLGFDKDKLYVTNVRENFSGGTHMVLSYFEKDGEPPLILDNLSFRVLDLKTREDLSANIFMNEKGSYKITKYNQLIRVGDAPQKFIELLNRVKSNH
jgi:predicted transglutaminase-like cysteine proteinase